MSTESTDHSSIRTADPTWESTRRLGQRLRHIRLTRHLTQAQLAKDLFSVSYVSGVERGQIRPSLGALEQLANRLEVPLVELATDGGFDPTSRFLAVRSRETASERHRQAADRALREAQILTYQHKSDEAITRLHAVEQAQLSPRQRVLLQSLLASCYSQRGQAEEARQAAQEALPEAEKGGEQDLAVRLRLTLSWAFSLLLDHAAALEQCQLAEQALQDELVRDPAMQLIVLLQMADTYHALTDRDQALAALTRASTVAKELVRPEFLGSHYWTLSQALAAANQHMDAEPYAARSVATYERAALSRAVTVVYAKLGVALARTGQLKEAVAQLQTANMLATGQDDLEGVAEVQRALAQIYLQENRYDDAHQAAQAALEAAEQLTDVSWQASVWLMMARIQEEKAPPEDATTSYERAIELLHAQQAAPALPASEQLRDVYAHFSEYLERQGESERAFGMLKLAYKSRR